MKTVSDSREAGKILEKIKETTGERPGKLVADAGYGNMHTLETCEKAGVIPVVATARDGKKAEGEETVPVLSGYVLDEAEASPDALRCSHGTLFLWVYVTCSVSRKWTGSLWMMDGDSPSWWTAILSMMDTPRFPEVVYLLRDHRAGFTPPPGRSQALSRFRMESPFRVIV